MLQAVLYGIFEKWLDQQWRDQYGFRHDIAVNFYVVIKHVVKSHPLQVKVVLKGLYLLIKMNEILGRTIERMPDQFGKAGEVSACFVGLVVVHVALYGKQGIEHEMRVHLQPEHPLLSPCQLISTSLFDLSLAAKKKS